MAQKITTVFIDDIDGGEAEETVSFALDGVEYEIDLSAEHSSELRATLGTYAEHARRVGAPARRRAPGRPARRGGAAAPAAAKLDLNAVRIWAKQRGFDVKDRGRVPGNIIAEYQKAGAAGAASA